MIFEGTCNSFGLQVWDNIFIFFNSQDPREDKENFSESWSVTAR